MVFRSCPKDAMEYFSLEFNDPVDALEAIAMHSQDSDEDMEEGEKDQDDDLEDDDEADNSDKRGSS